MQVDSICPSLQNRRKALVLGEQANAQMIAEQLESNGIEPVLYTYFKGERQVLPSIADPNSLAEIRLILSQFAESTQMGNRVTGIVHPGSTVWAERPELCSIAESLGLLVISPSSRILSLFSNRLNFLMEAERCGIPHLIQSFDPMHTVREVEEFTSRTHQRYPFVLKAVKGGGSFGVCVVQEPQTIEERLPFWLEQLRRNQGEAIFYAERYLEGARHIAVPFARFQDGKIQIFPTTDASLQCRYRKLIEISPAAQISPEMTHKLESWVKRLADHCGYVGVGVLEFLVDSSRAFLVEGLGRLNTGFHLWEQVARTQAVSWQLATLEINSDRQPEMLRDPKEWEHGISVRIYAEDSLFQLPQPGEVFETTQEKVWKFPGVQAEIALNYNQGANISIFDSGLIGILFVVARNRQQLFNLAKGLVSQFWIAGSTQTNQLFLSELLSHPWVREEIFHVGFIDEEFLPMVRPPVTISSLCVSILLSLPLFSEKIPMGNDFGKDLLWMVGDQYVRGGIPLGKSALDSVSHWLGDPCYWSSLGVSGVVRTDEGANLRVCAYPLPLPLLNRWLVRVGSWFVMVRQVLGESASGKKSVLSALVTGRVHAVLFRQGGSIPAHEPILMMESLGVFIPHALPFAAQVKSWKVKAEDRVCVGQVLAEIEVYKTS